RGAALEDRDLAAEDLVLEGAHRELEAAADHVELVREELLRLEEHLFADADLAEVVEERRVLELAEIVAGPGDALVGPGVAALDRAREADREIRDAARVTARRRIALLDRLDARAHEALQHVLYLGVEDRVLERDAGLRRQRAQEVFAPL